MSSKIPGRHVSTPSHLSGASVDDISFYDRGLLDRSTGSVVLRSSGPTPPKARLDGDVEKVKVYARIRPALRDDETPGAMVWSEDTGQLTIFRPEAPVPHSDFAYDKVLGPAASQADVYNTAVSEVVADVLRGYNGTILAYGQTGAGKTYTLGNTAPDAIGMIPRAAAELFSAASRDPMHLYSITMSYIQIYMEMIQDLLNPTADNLPIREDANGVFVAGACEVAVSSLEECLHYLELGEQNRVFAFTHLNAHSSRSHAVVMLTAVKSRKYLTSEERAQAEAPDQDGVVTQKVTVGKLYMVDLAGSERLKKSKSVGLRATEARSINLSLTTLGMCISARAQDSTHVPFRDSKLTRLLQESLGGNAKTSLILCLSDVRQHADESLQSLQFGARAACVRNKPVVNERLQMRQLTAELLAALEENHERADGLEAALSQTKEERDLLQAALAREKAHTAKIVDALRAEAKARDEQEVKLAAQAELLSEHVQQLGHVQQQQGQLEMEMEKLRCEHKAREEAHQQELAALQQRLAETKAEAEAAAAAAAAEREAIRAEARSQQAQLATAAQKQTSALAARLAAERAASRDQAASIHLALTRLQRALGELVAGPVNVAPGPTPGHQQHNTPAPPPPSQGGQGDEAEGPAHRPRVSVISAPKLADASLQDRGSSGGGLGEGSSVSSSFRGRSEGSAWGSYGEGGGGLGAAAAAAMAATPAGGDAATRRAQWMASLAAAVASRRGASTGSGSGIAMGTALGSAGGESSSGGSAVQLIKQVLGLSAAGHYPAGLSEPLDSSGGAAAGGVPPPSEAGGSSAGGAGYVGAVAQLGLNLPLAGAAGATAVLGAPSLDKPFISPPCSSPRSLGSAAVSDSLQSILPYMSRPPGPSGTAGGASLGGPAGAPSTDLSGRTGATATATATAAVTGATSVSGGGDSSSATELDLSDIDAALAAAQQDLLADLGTSVRAVQSGAAASGGGAASVSPLLATPQPQAHPSALLPTTGTGALPLAPHATPGASHPLLLDGDDYAVGDTPNGYAHADGRALLGDDDPSAASLGIPGGPQSLTVSSSSGGGGYGAYGDPDADGRSDDGAVNSYMSTPFMHATGRSAAAVAATNLASASGSSAMPNVAAAAGAAAGGDKAGLRLGSGTLNHNPAFDAADSTEEGLLKAPSESEEMEAGGGRGDVAAAGYGHAMRLRELGAGSSAAGSGGGVAVITPGQAAAAAALAAAPWVREVDISGGGGSDVAEPSPEGSLSMLLPPPTPAQVSGGPVPGTAGGVTRGSGLFAGIQVQLDSLMEMAAALRRIKAGLEQRVETQASELVRRQEEQIRLETTLGSTGMQLQASRAALAAAEDQLAGTVVELQDVRCTLEETARELDHARLQLDEQGASLQATQRQLGETAGALEDTARRLEETREEREAGREEGRRLAEELERVQAELSSERIELQSLLAASARNQQVTTQALTARHELQRQVRAANAIKRAYKAFKLAQLRGQVAAKQRALHEAAAIQRDREAAQAARAGQALVQESVAVIKDALGSILAAFVGRRYELEARRTLTARLDRMLPSAGGPGGPPPPPSGLLRRGSSPTARTAPSTSATAAIPRAATAAPMRPGQVPLPAMPTGQPAASSLTPLRGRLGSTPVSLSLMLAAATMPRTPIPAEATATPSGQVSAGGAGVAETPARAGSMATGGGGTPGISSARYHSPAGSVDTRTSAATTAMVRPQPAYKGPTQLMTSAFTTPRSPGTSSRDRVADSARTPDPVSARDGAASDHATTAASPAAVAGAAAGPADEDGEAGASVAEVAPVEAADTGRRSSSGTNAGVGPVADAFGRPDSASAAATPLPLAAAEAAAPGGYARAVEAEAAASESLAAAAAAEVGKKANEAYDLDADGASPAGSPGSVAQAAGSPTAGVADIAGRDHYPSKDKGGEAEDLTRARAEDMDEEQQRA